MKAVPTPSQKTCVYEHCNAVVPEWSAFCSRACEQATFMVTSPDDTIRNQDAMLSSTEPVRRHKAPRGSLQTGTDAAPADGVLG